MSETTTDLRALVEGLERLEKEATPGPWISQRYVVDRDGREVSSSARGSLRERVRVVDAEGSGMVLADVVAGTQTDARLFSAALNALPALLSGLREAWAERDAAEARLRAVEEVVAEWEPGLRRVGLRSLVDALRAALKEDK